MLKIQRLHKRRPWAPHRSPAPATRPSAVTGLEAHPVVREGEEASILPGRTELETVGRGGEGGLGAAIRAAP